MARVSAISAPSAPNSLAGTMIAAAFRKSTRSRCSTRRPDPVRSVIWLRSQRSPTRSRSSCISPVVT